MIMTSVIILPRSLAPPYRREAAAHGSEGSPVTRQPIAEDLFTWPDDDPSLIGGCCLRCETYTFPVRTGCPNCGATTIESRLLERTGTLWTWTSQGFPPKAPFTGTFSPLIRSSPGSSG